MIPALEAMGLRAWFETRTGFELAPELEELRQDQKDIVDWAMSRREPYLLINAPTGIGKTLANSVVAAAWDKPWTYVVHTNALQEQVSSEILGLPTLRGRDNFVCLLGPQTYGFDVTAARGVCVFNEACPHASTEKQAYLNKTITHSDCEYYEQRNVALFQPARVTNYSMFLSLYNLRDDERTKNIICDEAHRIEDVIIGHESVEINKVAAMQLKVRVPFYGDDISRWSSWARNVQVKSRSKYDYSAKKLRDQLLKIGGIGAPDNWVVQDSRASIRFTPIFGGGFLLPSLLGHNRVTGEQLLEGDTGRHGIERAVFSSATLLGPELVERRMGLPNGSWAYLDLGSPFPVANRPVNYKPIARMNRESMNNPAVRQQMSDAMDNLIDHYLTTGRRAGMIHAVSNRYRDDIVARSRWRNIMVTSVEEHESRVEEGRPSVLVSANTIDGWDGRDEFCRFVLIPKVPFPNLGDKHVRARLDRDRRSYDYAALVSVVQAVGRGVRHETDSAESWILDSSWEALYNKRKSWLPKSFVEAYHHGV